MKTNETVETVPRTAETLYGVAATKSFTSQVAILTAIGLLLGRMRHLSTSEGTRIIEALEELPEQIEEVLKPSRPTTPCSPRT